MSNKTQLQTNNTALDGYIARINAAKEVAAGLPEAGGSGGSGSGGTISVAVQNQSISPVYYWDVNGTAQEVAASSVQTVDALNGVLFYRQELDTICSGDYIKRVSFGYVVVMFLSNGGLMNCAGGT